MTQSINKPEFKAQLAEYEAKKAIDKALKPAPAVAKVQKGLIPTPKAAKTSPAKKAGRIVGISKDENEFLYNLLTSLKDCPDHAKMVESAAYTKLIGRYNK